jgi:sugar lactone lactonase YvrE
MAKQPEAPGSQCRASQVAKRSTVISRSSGPDNGWPDGMAIDSTGHAWVALTAADRIDVIDAAGNRRAAFDLPAGSLPTNVCIGGPNLDELYVTAAHSGSVLRLRFDDSDHHGLWSPGG